MAGCPLAPESEGACLRCNRGEKDLRIREAIRRRIKKLPGGEHTALWLSSGKLR
jgi:hypothetical protein